MNIITLLTALGMILGDFNVELHSASNSLQSHCVEVIIVEWNKEKDLKDKMRKKRSHENCICHE